MRDADQERWDDHQPNDPPIVYPPPPDPEGPTPGSPVFPPPDRDEALWREHSPVFPPPNDDDDLEYNDGRSSTMGT